MKNNQVPVTQRWVDRRRTPRMHPYDEVSWRGIEDATSRRALLVGISQTGLALVTRHGETPHCGGTIVPGKTRTRQRWTHRAQVKRVEPLSDSLDLVAAMYSSS